MIQSAFVVTRCSCVPVSVSDCRRRQHLVMCWWKCVGCSPRNGKGETKEGNGSQCNVFSLLWISYNGVWEIQRPTYFFIISTKIQYCYLQLYWDLQLLNVGNLSTLYVMDKHVSVDPHVLNCPDQSTDPNAFKQAVRGKELCGSVRGVKRLKKAARQCWARWASYNYTGAIRVQRQILLCFLLHYLMLV